MPKKTDWKKYRLLSADNLTLQRFGSHYGWDWFKGRITNPNHGWEYLRNKLTSEPIAILPNA